MRRAIYSLRLVRLSAVCLLVAGAGCSKTQSSEPVGKTHTPTAPPKAPPMTNMDPNSPEAWKQAEAIAATVATGPLEKRSDALPFMFMADSPAAVLVHKGRVVTETGPAAAGAYLRDLGMIQGKGPEIADVLFVLFALDAWPPVEGVNEEAYINVPGDARLSDLTARTEYDGESAQVVLHYFLPEPAPSAADMENDVGDIDPEARQPVARPILRCTLHIPATGDAAWKIEKLNWADPAGAEP